MLNDKQLKTVMALLVFAVAFVAYILTMAPTVSFWDCGELVAASHILGNPHPPGNPLFTTIARAFIVVLPFKEVAARVNFISVLCSALTVMVGFLFIVRFMQILFKGSLSRFSLYCAGVIAAFLMTFSDTFWFSAVEAEVYSASMLLVMTICWLTLDWYENRGTAKAKRNLILIAYLAYLGMGIHPFSFITMPVVALFLLFVDKDLRTDVPLLLTGAGLMSVIFDLGDFMWYALALLVLNAIFSVVATSPEWRAKWRFSMWISLVAILGFSSYAYVPLRSAVGPNIDEGEPKTYANFKEYLERKQYGSESMLKRAFHRRGQLRNQLLAHPHMGYGGYMLAQYLPWKQGETRADENEVRVRRIGSMKLEFKTLRDLMGDNPKLQWILFVLFQFPFLYGGWLAYKRNPHLGGYLLGLYVVTSFGLIFYMNFADGTGMEMRDYEFWAEKNFDPKFRPDPVHLEVRDRDYFWTPGYLFMSLLFGVAAAFLLEKLQRAKAGGTGAARGVGLALALVALVVPSWSNWKEHDRSGDYVPWDYAHNLLMSCRPNSVLFTNGDNDTFPLWFIQEVEGVRKDVRVVNLSLVNTNWYIKQLRSREPSLNIGFTDKEIDEMQPRGWDFKQTVVMPLPNSAIKVELEPRPYLKVQDIMVLHIVQNNYPKHPIHFAVTVSDDNMMGLEKYQIMEGMVYTLVEEKKNKEIDAMATARLVDSVYKFRGLGDPKVYIDLNTEGLLTNYSATNFRLVMWAQEQIAALDRRIDEMKKANAAADSVAVLESEKKDKIAFAERYLNLNRRILPREWRNSYYGAQFYSGVKDFAKAEDYYRRGLADAPNPKLFGANLAQLYIEQGRFAQAESLLVSLKDKNPNDFELWYGLSDLYQKQGQPAKARVTLSEWLKGNPGHQYASMVQQQIQFLDAQKNAAPAATDSGAKVPAPGAGVPAPAAGQGGIPGLAPSGGDRPAPGAQSPQAPTQGGDTAGKGKGPAGTRGPGAGNG